MLKTIKKMFTYFNVLIKKYVFIYFILIFFSVISEILLLIPTYLACIMFSMPVLAASSSTSKTLSKMNALNGMTAVKDFTVSSSGTITNVKIYLNVSSGSDPFKIYLVSPEGTEYELTPSTKNGTYNTTAFNGESPKGKWYFYVENLNITYNPVQLYPTSTVTPTVTLTYNQ